MTKIEKKNSKRGHGQTPLTPIARINSAGTDKARKQANREKASRYYNSHKEIVLQKLKIKTTPAVQRNKEHLILKRKVRQLRYVAVKLDFEQLKSFLD